MAVGHRLPNGYVVLLLTPREATLTRDQLLEPNEYPWTGSESQMVGMEVRNILTAAVAEDASIRLAEASKEMIRAMATWVCPNCDARNAEENRDCGNCGYELGTPPEAAIEQVWRCPNCGHDNHKDASPKGKCMSCGYELEL